MKFSLWLEGRRRKKRNLRSATRIPDLKSSEELAIRGASARVHDMSGVGDRKTYGRAGTMGDQRRQRARSKEEFRRSDRDYL